jgi:hypothetical protein
MSDTPPAPDSPAALFQTWQFQPAPAAPGVSYSIDKAGTEAGTEAYPVWRLDLPADPSSAEMVLAERQEVLGAVQLALEDVPARLASLVQHAQLTGGVGPSFAPPSAEALPEPEAEALELLHALELPAVGLSYAAGSEERRGLEQAFDQFKADIDDLLRLVTHFAWVETEQDGRLIGRTVVGWSGDLDTLWHAGLTPEQRELHHRSLRQALASRNILLHAVVVTLRSAAKLAVLLTTPGGALLAVPVAWKFVKEIMADIEKYKLIAETPL